MRNYTRVLVILAFLTGCFGLVKGQCSLATSGVVTDETCPAFYDGYIDLSVTGATGLVSYTWSTGDLTEDIFGVTSGTYYVTVTDGVPCTVIDTFTVTDAHGITVSLGNDTTLCAIVNYVIVPNTQGATFYYWQNGDQTTTFTANDTGYYYLFVQNSFGCYDDDSLHLSAFPRILTSTTTTQPGCDSAVTGAIDLTASGGATPFSYLWSTTATSQDVSNLAPGFYTVTVTDANQCTASTSAHILAAADLSDFEMDNTLICSLDTVHFRSHTYGFMGDAVNDYIRLPDTLPIRPTGSFTLEAWIKPNSVVGASQVVAEKRIVSGDGVSLTYNPVTRKVGAHQQSGPFSVDFVSTGTIQTGVWGHITYTYDGLFARLYIDEVLDTSTVYTNGTAPLPGVAWTVGGGPGRTSFNGPIDEIRFWNMALSSDDVEDMSDRALPQGTPGIAFYLPMDEVAGAATITDLGPHGLTATITNANVASTWVPSNPMDYSFLWNFGDGNINNFQNPSYQYLPNTLIPSSNTRLRVTTHASCVSSDTIHAYIHTPGNPNIATSLPGPFCLGDSIWLYTATPYATYNWNNGSSTNDSILVTTSGTYTLSVDDGNGCTNNDTLVMQYAPTSAPRPDIVPVDSVSICEGDTVNLSVGSGYATYLWSNGATTQTLDAHLAGAYSVQVSNGFGCIRFSDTAFVVLKPAPLASITEINDTLYASTGVYYQWYLDSVYIPGAIGPYYVPLVSGNYYVRVGVLAECDALSDPYSFLVGMADAATDADAVLFPNPTNGASSMRIVVRKAGKWDFRLMDLQGRVLWHSTESLLQGLHELALPTSALPAGTYLVQARGRDGMLTRKLLKY